MVRPTSTRRDIKSGLVWAVLVFASKILKYGLLLIQNGVVFTIFLGKWTKSRLTSQFMQSIVIISGSKVVKMVVLGNYEKQMPSRCSGAVPRTTILTTLEQEIMTNSEDKLLFVHLSNKIVNNTPF